MKRGTKYTVVVVTVLMTAAATVFYTHGRSIWVPMVQKVTGKHSVDEVLSGLGPNARARLEPFFAKASLSYPPQRITLLAIKDTARLELWVETPTAPVHVRSYDIQALGGGAGPKLREGDRQVPEGIYQVDGLNPNSSYHLSLKLNYPNAFDLEQAQAEGRTEPGSNIFIHGKAVSVGCLAMGDEVIEELFVLAADIGRGQVRVVITPSDPRLGPLSFDGPQPWGSRLYKAIEAAFQKYPGDRAASGSSQNYEAAPAIDRNNHKATLIIGSSAHIGTDTGISHVRS